MKKRDTAAKKSAVDDDESEKLEKSKTEDTESKSDAEKESDKKKSTKKPSDDDNNENDENKDADESIDDSKTDATNDADKLPIDKSSDAEGDSESVKKGDDKDKRKKFVRLFCPHCRIESATFKVTKKTPKKYKHIRSRRCNTNYFLFFFQ